MSSGDPDAAGRKSAILDEWCQRLGRDPAEIERAATVRTFDQAQAEHFVEKGFTHLLTSASRPDYENLTTLEQLVRWRDTR